MPQMVSLLQILLLAQHVSCTITHHQEIKSIIQVVAACGIWCLGFRVCGMLQTGHTTHSSTPDRQLENQNNKYHRQQLPV
jgi:hypothetical protein